MAQLCTKAFTSADLMIFLARLDNVVFDTDDKMYLTHDPLILISDALPSEVRGRTEADRGYNGWLLAAMKITKIYY